MWLTHTGIHRYKFVSQSVSVVDAPPPSPPSPSTSLADGSKPQAFGHIFRCMLVTVIGIYDDTVAIVIVATVVVVSYMCNWFFGHWGFFSVKSQMLI